MALAPGKVTIAARWAWRTTFPTLRPTRRARAIRVSGISGVSEITAIAAGAIASVVASVITAVVAGKAAPCITTEVAPLAKAALLTTLAPGAWRHATAVITVATEIAAPTIPCGARASRAITARCRLALGAHATARTKAAGLVTRATFGTVATGAAGTIGACGTVGAIGARSALVLARRRATLKTLA